jgi:hypothetical protein
MRRFVMVLLILASTFLATRTALAQATLGGVVRDTSGAVVPGVTVEAASPVLIEKARTTVTDGSGQYRIVDLRGGTYTITFTLSGFATVKREGVQLAGEGVTTVNSELRVGTLDQTVTVTGEAATVDLQSTTRQAVISKEVIDTLPTGRNYSSLGLLLTGVNTTRPDSGGALGDPMASLTVHGSRPGDQRILQNGVNTMTLQAGGDIGIAVPNPGMASEVTVDTSGVSAEQYQGGVRINYIPKDGGNQFSGSTFVGFANNSMQGDNLTDELRSRGLSSTSSIKQLYDVNPGFGGPFRRNKVWFYFTGRVNRADQNVGGAYVNKNAYDPRNFTYEPDLSRPAYNRTLWTDAQIRTTAQVTPRNKVAFTWDQQTRCSCPGTVNLDLPWAISSTTSPEASANFRSPTQRLLHAEWSSPLTNKVLVEALALHRTERWGFMHPTASAASDFISPAEEAILTSGALVPIIDAQTGRWSHGNFLQYNNNWVPNYFFRASMSYVGGGHQIKVGASDVVGFLESTVYNFSPYSYVTNIVPGLPLAVIAQNVRPVVTKSDQNYDLGLFAQDRWTMNQLTISYGVRFDAFKASSPPQHVVGPTPLTPNRPDIDFPKTVYNSWKDITTRFGAVYDVAGDGKTALKVSLNKYLQSQTVGPLSGFAGSGGLNPVNRLVNSTNRIWFDANGDFVPQCDLTNLGPTGECGPVDRPNFGLNDPNALQFSEDSQFGWGKRGYNWEFGAGIQHEIFPRVSVDVGYFRRWYGNFLVTDNTALGPQDFTKYTVTVPTRVGLPTAGDTITLFDPNRNVAQRNLTTRASDYGKQIEHWNGVDFSVNARLPNGVFLFGGINTGKTSLDSCEIAAKVPESLTVTPLGSPSPVSTPLEYCKTESPFLTQVKLNGAYLVPKVDVLVSATFQSIPGPPVRAQATYTERAPGVPLVGNSSQTVALTHSQFNAFLLVVGEDYGDRLNQVDLRIAKVLRLGKTRTSINFDLFNLLNGSAATRENATLGTYFRQPIEIMLARFIKIGAQFDF